MTVRKYEESDRDDIIALWEECFEYAGEHNLPNVALDAKLAVDDLLFVYERDGQIVGSVMAGYDGHRGWLYSVCVTGSVRRQGVGGDLVNHALAALEELGCMKINLQVRTNNCVVTNFYSSLGFEVEKRISMGKRVLGS